MAIVFTLIPPVLVSQMSSNMIPVEILQQYAILGLEPTYPCSVPILLGIIEGELISTLKLEDMFSVLESLSAVYGGVAVTCLSS